MKLAAFIDLEDALGVDFIKNTVRVSDIVVPGRGGETVTLEITDGGCDIVPRWASDGTLTRMDFRAHVSATVLEAGGRADLDSVDYAAYLTEQLEDYVTEKISRVLSLSAKLGSDFLALGSAAELDDPALYRLLPMQFDSYLGELEMRVAVKGADQPFQRYTQIRTAGGEHVNTDHSFNRRQLLAACTVFSSLRRSGLCRGGGAHRGRAAWVSVPLALPGILLYIWFVHSFFARRGDGEGMGELVQRALGRRAAQAVLGLFAAWFLLYGSFMLRSGRSA